MSDTAFSRFFKKNTGNSFTDHVNKLRIWQACKLLAESDMPITDICFEVGYLNISNFNRTFLRHHRMTPSAYRRLTGQRRTSRS
ncbi:HTH-type transcriptional activator RhaR [compost metagenome]